MQHRIETKVGPDGTIVLNNLPFREGETVEIIVIADEQKDRKLNKYPLRGKPIFYDRPFDGVAENDWGVLS